MPNSDGDGGPETSRISVYKMLASVGLKQCVSSNIWRSNLCCASYACRKIFFLRPKVLYFRPDNDDPSPVES